MLKRVHIFLLALLAALTLTVPAFGEQQQGDYFVYDTEGLLTDEQLMDIEMRADRFSWQYNCAIYVVTVYDYEDYGSSPYDAAANIYNNEDFGIGNNRDGVLLLLSMWGRDYALYVRDDGFAQNAIDDYGRTVLEDSFLAFFGNDDWYGGFSAFVNTCGRMMGQAAAGEPVRKPLTSVIAPALLIGCGSALVVCLILKGKMKTVRKGTRADTYAAPEGLLLTERMDMYTHTTEERRRIEKNESHSGGGGSGSSGKF